MTAMSLPLEIQQQIFSVLDSKSFHNARNVCRWWHYASMGPLILQQQLRKMPLHSRTEMKHLQPIDLDRLFSQAAHRLLFGLSVARKQSSSGPLQSPCKSSVRPKTAASKDGKRLVTLNERTVSLFEVTGQSHTTITQRLLQDLRGLPIGCPGLQPGASAPHCLALSSDGGLLAVAMARTIQIYNLSEGCEHEVITRHIADPYAHHVVRLGFDQDDHLLQVQLTGGTVLYLGSLVGDGTGLAGFAHWNGECGLKHTFMDSSRLIVASYEKLGVHLSCVQLLRRWGDGYLFGAQRHGGGVSSRYLLGYLRCATNTYTSTQAVDHTSVIELTALETFLSCRELNISELSNLGMGTWETMPSAHEDPRFALCGDLLIVAEKDKKSMRSLPLWTHLFVYRVPDEHGIKSMVKNSHSPTTAEKFGVAHKIDGHSIAAIPLCIDGVAGEIQDIKFNHAGPNRTSSRTLEVRTDEETKAWTLVG